MAIYILEDNIFQNNYLKQVIQTLSEQHHYQLGPTIVTSRPQELLEACQNATNSCNLYFLDIKIKENETAGLATARKIRSLEPSALIAFVTTYADLALKSYEYRTAAFAYILKSNDEEAFIAQINDCLETYSQQLANQDFNTYFAYEDRFTRLRIPFNELYYISTFLSHKILVKTKKKELLFHGALRELEKADPRLIRCHKSFLVNLSTAQMIDKTRQEIIYPDEITVPIARKSLKIVQEAWDEQG